jgi:hypothetical protein
MMRCKSISDCKTPRSCFGTFGECLGETVEERRIRLAERGQQVERQLDAINRAVNDAVRSPQEVGEGGKGEMTE